jgi:3-hydroxyisobutyrate dehydrogenase
MKTAVLGLGLMGSAIARRLKEQGQAVVGWNRTPDRLKRVSGLGVETADSAANAIAAADVCLLVLTDHAAAVDTLFRGDAPRQLAGRVFVQMGTIAPSESRDLAGRVSSAGGAYLEAPVLGSLPEAESGSLLVMAGGEQALFERCLPVLQCLGRDPRLVGPVGRAAALKLAMNQLIAGLTATFSLSLGLVRAEGIDVEEFMGVVRNSALYAPTFDKKLPKYLSHDYAQTNFPLKHLLKDVRLFRRVAEPLALDSALITTLEAACARAMAQGYGDQDYSAVYEALAPGG